MALLQTMNSGSGQWRDSQVIAVLIRMQDGQLQILVMAVVVTEYLNIYYTYI